MILGRYDILNILPSEDNLDLGADEASEQASSTQTTVENGAVLQPQGNHR